MTAPFRELFVELPAALLEILRGVVEARITPAETAPARRSVGSALCEAIENGPIGQSLCERYGWEMVYSSRSPRDRSIEIVGVRPCRYPEHYATCSICDELLESAAPKMVSNVVLSAIDRAASQPCYCVARSSARGPRRSG